MFKPLIAAALVAAFVAPAALAGPAERLGHVSKRVSVAERNGVWAQGTPADRAEDRLDRREDVVDRRESRRDEAFDRGPLDVIEDRADRRESRRDRAENRTDRAS